MLCFQQNKLSMSPWQTEKEGFEPSRRYQRPTPFPGEPLRPAWVLLQNVRYLIYTILPHLSSTFFIYFKKFAAGCQKTAIQNPRRLRRLWFTHRFGRC